MSQYIPFNLNHTVRVKVLPEGFRILEADDASLQARFSRVKLPARAERIRAEQDANDGWSRWQLWSLMEIFGPHISLGSNTPFETTIELDVES